MRQTVILIGFMGAGKTTVGKLLAEKMQQTFIDLDQLFEIETGCKIPDYFQKYGETAFRKLERQLLQTILNEKAEPKVIATGGGIILTAENRQLLKETKNITVIYLKTSVDQLVLRLQQDTQIRPVILEKSITEIKKIYQERLTYYEECAHITIPTDQLTPEIIVEKIGLHLETN